VTFRCVLVLWLFMGVVGLWGDDAVDGLFDQAKPDITTETQTQTKVDTAALTTAPLSVSGHVNANTGALVGQDPGGFFNFGTDLAMDARPDPSIRIHGDVGTGLSAAAISALAINELYLDYTLLNTAVFRFGKYTLTWGQGRLFNPGNLVSDSPNGVTFKVAGPLLGQSATLVILQNPSVMVNANAPTWREVSYASQFSGDLGPLGWGLAALVRPGTILATPLRYASVFLKTSNWGIDFYTEGVVMASTLVIQPIDLHYVAGFFWEGGDPKWQLQGEATDTRWGSTVRVTGLELSPALHWEQSRLDGSGMVSAGVTWAPLPHLTLDFGIPVLYGSDSSEYLVNDADPYKQRLGLGIRVTLDSQY